ncbi:MAG: IS1380 family transposase [Desulfobacterales bacterium]|nr:IS1380 family transposase [Desulfobacterales bacterium]
MTKIEKNNPIINPFGGIIFAIDAIKEAGVPEVIDNLLGKRAAQAKYSYSDILMNLWSIFFCGGDCAEDINNHLKDYLSSIPDNPVANSDTILGILKSLKTEKEEVVSSTNNIYEINKHDKLNELNIKILKSLGLLISDELYNFDYDNEVLPTEKYDTKHTYKKTKGYFPGMATIAGMPVYFENRDGNMNVKTGQVEVLERCFKMLADNGIKIDKCRMDAGSYARDIVEIATKFSENFYIRANRCEALRSELLNVQNWETVEINYITYEVCSINYQPFIYKKGEEKKTYRLVVSREKMDNAQLDIFTGDNMKYRSILTDDWKKNEKEVIEYYNARGTEEKTIDILNNDFGWNKMPFSFMEENTVFLIVMMICKNIYTYLICKFSKIFTDLKKNFRIKKFIFRFIILPVKWIESGRYNILKTFSTKPYEKLKLLQI